MSRVINCIKCLFIVCCVSTYSLQTEDNVLKVKYQYNIEKWLNNIDFELSQLNSVAAHLTWKLSTDPDEKTSQQARQLGKVRNRWKNDVCDSKIKQDWLTNEQKRKLFLLCRGPKFSDDMVLEYLEIFGKLEQEYNSEICLKAYNFTVNYEIKNFPQPGDCLYGEPDLERLMKRTDLDSSNLKWIWMNWHDSIGPRIKELYKTSINYQNEAARLNGYHDIGETWREELEIPELETFVFNLYEELQELYSLLHAVVRHKLFEKYGPTEIDPKGPIPVHLLGNMWAQDWSPLIDLFQISFSDIDLNKRLQEKQLRVVDLVLEAEDFYTSLNLPKMTEKFWKYSIFEQDENSTLCHGTAANLYSQDDFRILMCGKTTMDDFYVIHHEMGHIEYYMAYQDQSTVFQEGTNTAFHESIGDAIMHGVMTPQHLHRLSLITDKQLLDNNTEFYLLFQQALSKIPEIPFSLVVDKFRWDVFRDEIPFENWNEYYWALNIKYRGVKPPTDRSNERLFDAGAKFHVPDNTPYIRYFLSSIIQMQIFRSLCELSLYGNNKDKTEYLPLHRCDIYGSKTAGRKLLEMMEKGASIHWTEALSIISGSSNISLEPFLKYYDPIYKWLKQYVVLNNIYVGW